MKELMNLFGEVPAADGAYYAREKLTHHVAERILAALERKGITMQEIARRLNKHKSFISQVLKGNRNMTLGTIADICEAADLEVEFEVRNKSYFSQVRKGELVWSEPEAAFQALRNVRSANDPVHYASSLKLAYSK